MTLPSFTTARLTLRPLVAGDIEPLFDLIYADPQVRQYFTNITERAAAEHVHQIQGATNADPANGGLGYWVAVGRTSAIVLGKRIMAPPEPGEDWIALDPASPTLPLGDETELGYVFGRRFWGLGYAVESCRALIEYAFGTLGLPRLVNSVRRANDGSVSLMERLGFRMVANLRNDALVVGVLTPTGYASATTPLPPRPIAEQVASPRGERDRAHGGPQAGLNSAGAPTRQPGAP